MNLEQALHLARREGDFGPLVAAIPYARFLGLSLEVVDGRVRGCMSFREQNVGNPVVKALHGGTLGALLEFTAIGHLLHVVESAAVPKTINLTVEYLRQAHLEDTYARCEVLRLGRRVAVVRVVAYQRDEAKPVTTATAHFLLSPLETLAVEEPVAAPGPSE